MTSTILPTRNEAWGFYGTIDQIRNDLAADPAKAWPIAFEAISLTTKATPEGVRDFLDSRYGRHFADSVADELNRGDTLKEAIATATARWMNWRVGRTTSRETGIPAELPLLTGLATHFEVLAEMQPEG
jgi:hypothetical protein